MGDAVSAPIHPDLIATLTGGFSANVTPGMTERERELVRLRLASPVRARADQRDVNDCPLFVAANEPRFL
jgi:hypothetical protein